MFAADGFEFLDRIFFEAYVKTFSARDCFVGYNVYQLAITVSFNDQYHNKYNKSCGRELVAKIYKNIQSIAIRNNQQFSQICFECCSKKWVWYCKSFIELLNKIGGQSFF